MDRTLLLLTAPLLLLALTPAGGAHGDWYHCDITTEVPIEIPGTQVGYLIAGRPASEEGIAPVYLYLESNEEPHLQRGGEGLVTGRDPCRESTLLPPDQLVW